MIRYYLGFTTGKVRGNQIEVNLTVDFGNYTKTQIVRVNNGTTVFDVLNSKTSVSYKNYSTGRFVTGINGVMQDKEHYWIYFVNGKPPMMAVDKYRLMGDSTVTFRYMSAEEAMKIFKK